MDVGWKMQNVTFSKFHPKNQVHFSLISKDQKHKICLRNTIQPFNIHLNTFVTAMVRSGHNDHHQKTMHFSVTPPPPPITLHFPTNEHP